jgi:leucyl-tRNA synthetase
MTYKFIEKGAAGERAQALLKGDIETILRLLFPFVPHIVSELWQTLGGDVAYLGLSWPTWNADLVKEEKVMIAVQINGKLRDTCEADRDMEQETLKDMILALEKVQRHLEGKTIRKTIVVPNKLVNIVCG